MWQCGLILIEIFLKNARIILIIDRVLMAEVFLSTKIERKLKKTKHVILWRWILQYYIFQKALKNNSDLPCD